MRDHLRLMRLRLTVVAAALVVVAPAAHAFTMNTITNPESTPTYVAPTDQLEELAKKKTTPEPGISGLQFKLGPSTDSTWGNASPFHRFAPRSPLVGEPPDQSRFNDR